MRKTAHRSAIRLQYQKISPGSPLARTECVQVVGTKKRSMSVTFDTLPKSQTTTPKETMPGSTMASPAKKSARHWATGPTFLFDCSNAAEFAQIKPPRQFLYQFVFAALHLAARAGAGVVATQQMQDAVGEIADDLFLPGAVEAPPLLHGVVEGNEDFAAQGGAGIASLAVADVGAKRQLCTTNLGGSVRMRSGQSVV